jgi:Sec-independent protein translocase protein TatA
MRPRPAPNWRVIVYALSMFGLGVIEIAILVGVILLVVGPAKAPGVARMLGRGVKEVRETVTTPQQEIRDALLGDIEAKPAAKKPGSSSSSP